MRYLQGTGGRRYRGDVQTASPGDFTIAIYSNGEWLSFGGTADSVGIDSLPAVFNRERSMNFSVSESGLRADESLVVFFEPVERGVPHRILVTGPTSTGTVSLPTSATADLPPGAYNVYLVRQRLVRDRKQDLKLSLQTEYFTPSRPTTVR